MPSLIHFRPQLLEFVAQLDEPAAQAMQRQSLQASLPAGRDGQRRVERFVGGIVLGESDQASTDDEEQANLRVRLIGELVVNPGAGLPQQSHRGQRFGRVGIGEKRRDELLHLFRRVSVRSGRVGPGARNTAWRP